MAINQSVERIAKLTGKNCGPTEENVKQKIIVPLLELLGHERENLEKQVRTRVSEIWNALGLPLDLFRIPTPLSRIKTDTTSRKFIGKARKVTLQELVGAGLIKDGRTLFFSTISELVMNRYKS